jgi:hypothetical protein
MAKESLFPLLSKKYLLLSNIAKCIEAAAVLAGGTAVLGGEVWRGATTAAIGLACIGFTFMTDAVAEHVKETDQQV